MECTASPFIPPHCPNPGCRYHCPSAGWRYRRLGCFIRLAIPHRIQRYQCGHCRRSFSTQTFRTDYWLRQPGLLRPLFWRLLGCSGYRQIAREFGISPQTAMRQCARLGRHCLLFHDALRPRGPIEEPLTLDGFESFEFSQYHPTHYHVAVGQRSHFFYGFTDSELRRKGRMSERQRQRRAGLEQHFGRPDPRSIEREVAALLRVVLEGTAEVELHSDDHPAYPRALRHLAHRVRHQVTPGSAHRTPRNPLFPVNLLDLLIRHGSANHKRETIAFSKRRQSAIERLWLVAVWRNYMKAFSERKRDATPAMRLRLMARALSIEELLEHRMFPSRIPLPERWKAYYIREITTRRIARCARHRLTYAA